MMCYVNHGFQTHQITPDMLNVEFQIIGCWKNYIAKEAVRQQQTFVTLKLAGAERYANFITKSNRPS